MASAQQTIPAVDGLRAFSTLSMVALHASILGTVYTTIDTREWSAYVHTPVAGFLKMAGCQVDALLVLSGLLLGLRLRTHLMAGTAGSTLSITRGVSQYAISRATRLWPVILFNIALLYALGDSLLWVDLKTRVFAFIQCLTFTYNYFSVVRYGSCTMTVMWSVCADYQMGIILVALLYTLRRIVRKDSTFLACVRGMLLSLFLASFAIRYALWDPAVGNDVLMGKRPHFGVLLTKISYNWVKDGLGFRIDPAGIVSRPADLLNDTLPHHSLVNDAAEDLMAIMGRLYFPTHARYGAMVVGMLMAFCVDIPLSPKGAKKLDAGVTRKVLSHVCSMLLTVWAVGSLLGASSSVPTDEDIAAMPLEAQLIVTVVFRNIVALALAAILLLAMNPPGSFLRSPPLAFLLGSRVWKPVAKLSYGINMVHFRVMLELVTKYIKPARENAPDHWYTLQIYLATLVLSSALSFLCSKFWEAPAQRALSGLLAPPKSKVN
uniref:Acyltransferase 3 domain-containing protein n=1 Tax=Pyramimonas obovata TaxID=1411642 RepID=A0A7S0WUE7_9CHLO|mmetsp:Transcript_4214/g.8693  ORF Transcript_4214/g.8693 Transcript_4214/m.8693 type:complete len:491 (+) Transcript_4214:209-1681(+)|eukprot:CAMPEP_0118941558 /NCGR_PEP_ID=MMETSP1169-20130426/34139_1 /TAXON_ID=36882 /ORGANISM="Pyramimonas obovata, Strain CCMP722" /LENGTH=490 /DNA_ID=CAMNT_0006886339 /DNA_START=113 /DNA_END=1585 /DNA_ORIENTATION=-